MINKSHALLFFTFTQQLWSRPAFRSEFTASRETETGKTKTWYFHNLVQFIVIHWVKFWLCQCHYLISCSIPNTRSCQPAWVLAAKTICCPLCKAKHFLSTCAFITFHQTSGVFPFTRSSNTFLWRCSSFPPFVLPQQDVAWGRRKDGTGYQSNNSLVPHPTCSRSSSQLGNSTRYRELLFWRNQVKLCSLTIVAYK